MINQLKNIYLISQLTQPPNLFIPLKKIWGTKYIGILFPKSLDDPLTFPE